MFLEEANLMFVQMVFPVYLVVAESSFILHGYEKEHNVLHIRNKSRSHLNWTIESSDISPNVVIFCVILRHL
jgi:hypothetical protein